MNIRQLFLFLTFMLCARFLYAQNKQTTSFNEVWLGYSNQTRLSDKWGFIGDINLRTRKNFFTNFYHAIGRAGITYYLSEACKLSVGYAYVNNYPDDGHKDISQPEHRPWQQLQWQQMDGKKILLQRLRLEERYRHNILNDSTLAPGYTMNFRGRYSFNMQVPFSRKGIAPRTFSFVGQDEVLVNFGKSIVYNYFDQNRFFAGLGYQTTAFDHVQAGYMNIFQQLSSGNKYRNFHIIRVFYYHTIDARRRRV